MRSVAVAAVVVASLLVLVPAAAQADGYMVDFCKPWTGGGGGVAFADVSGHNVNTCGNGGALIFQRASAAMGTAEAVNITLSIPADRPNVRMDRVQTEYTGPGSTGGGGTFLHIFDIFGQRIDSALGGEVRVLDLQLTPGNRSLLWGIVCTASPCTVASQNLVEVRRARLYLSESVAPMLARETGSLVSPGPKSGLVALAFDAADTDSGVKSVSVALGSTVVGTIEYPCGISDWSVCRRDQANQMLTVDTTKVPNGSHELVVTVRDAANNVLTRSLGPVTVANGPSAGAPNGTPASRLAKLSVRYTTTARRSRILRFGSRPTVRGALVDERRRPIAGAVVTVRARRRQAGADPTQIATVTTGADGRFTHKLSGGPSRTITFAYTAYSGDAAPASTSTLRTAVRAVVTAKLAPRAVRVGGLVTITGRLALLPRAGVEVKIQPRQGRRWYTFGTVKTTRGGRFRWRYRFSNLRSGQSFVLRAYVDSPIYPFAAGNSRPLRVRVR